MAAVSLQLASLQVVSLVFLSLPFPVVAFASSAPHSAFTSSVFLPECLFQQGVFNECRPLQMAGIPWQEFGGRNSSIREPHTSRAPLSRVACHRVFSAGSLHLNGCQRQWLLLWEVRGGNSATAGPLRLQVVSFSSGCLPPAVASMAAFCGCLPPAVASMAAFCGCLPPAVASMSAFCSVSRRRGGREVGAASVISECLFCQGFFFVRVSFLNIGPCRWQEFPGRTSVAGIFQAECRSPPGRLSPGWLAPECFQAESLHPNGCHSRWLLISEIRGRNSATAGPLRVQVVSFSSECLPPVVASVSAFCGCLPNAVASMSAF